MTHKTAYIDGDVLMYRAAFAAEVVKYGLIEPNGDCYVLADTRKRAQNLVEGNERFSDCTVERVAEPLPFDAAKHKLNSDLHNIKKGTGYDRCVIFLSHPDRELSQRNGWAVTHAYKGNRKNMAAPYWKKEVFKYMVDTGAEVVEGIEADDALGYSVFNDTNGICVSIDKDLLMVPGKHYNITKGTLVEAEDPGRLFLTIEKYGKKLSGNGFKWFCAQMLMGDPVDNIVGLRGYGDVKTHKVLNPVELEGNLWRTVKNHYAMAGEEPGRLEENANLLWIQRNEGQLFEDWYKETTNVA